jgi:thiamine biosynthesis lipoprotein
MDTAFEIHIAGQPAEYARGAAQAAFAEIDRIEGYLSRFMESSDVSRINILGAKEPVRVSLETFECLQLAARISAETDGAFDVTRVQDGMKKVEFDKKNFAIRLKDASLKIDLGGIGKGFALDKVAAFLSDWSIESMLLHGGDSSVLAVGAPPGEEGWPVSVGSGMDEKDRPEPILLRDRALSASGTSVKGQHIIDPRTGQPAKGAIRAWASCPSATVSDALSTAFMVMGPKEVARYCREHKDTWAILLVEDDQGRRLVGYGQHAPVTPAE